MPFRQWIGNALSSAHDRIFGPKKDPAADIYDFLFHRNASYGALVLLLLAAALPPDGAGIPLCWFRGLTGLPCPGCGLTRAFSSIFHLHFAQALDYHPFGFLLLPLFLLIAAQLVLPSRWREGFQSFIRARRTLVRYSYQALVYGFLLFGSLRVVLYAWLGLRAI